LDCILFLIFPFGKLKCDFKFHFFGQKSDVLREGALLAENENQKDSPSSASLIASDLTYEFKHRRSSSMWNEELSPASSTVTESTQSYELMGTSKLAPVSYISLQCSPPRI
jgi:hypothetical protein